MDLHGDLVTSTGYGAVDLTDRGGGEWLAFPVCEQPAWFDTELVGDHELRCFRGQRRRLVAQLLQQALDLVLVARWRESVDVAEHLPKLHR